MATSSSESATWPPPPPLRSLEDILRSAVSHPIYTPLLQSQAPPPATLGAFPFLTKAHLLETMPQLLKPPYIYSTYLSPSGGTRGTGSSMPLFFATDTTDNRIQRFLLARMLAELHVLESTDIVLNLHGGFPMYRCMDLSSSMIDLAGATELAASNRATPAQAIEIAERFGANVIFAGGSKLMELATHLEHNPSSSLRIEKAIFTSEPLSAKQEAYLRRILNLRSVGSIYGSCEAGPFAASLPLPDVPTHREFVVDSRMFVVEIRCPSTAKILSSSLELSSDASGEIVFTSLCRLRHPVVRYCSGDLGSLHPYPNSSSSSPYFVLRLDGRNPEKSFFFDDEYIDISELDSRVFSKPEHRVLEWQLLIRPIATFEFRVVLEGDAAREQAILLDIEECVLGTGLDIVVRRVGYEDLERGSMAGKVRKVVDLRE